MSIPRRTPAAYPCRYAHPGPYGPPAPTEESVVSDLVVSYLRTIVPILWGALITWALGAVSWLPDALAFLNLDPQSAGVVTGVTGLVVAAWYVVWRKIEPSIPAWLTSIVLGASKAPTYDPGAVVLADGRTVREANADAAVSGVDRTP